MSPQSTTTSTPDAPACFATFDSASREAREQLGGDPLVHGVDRTVEADAGLEPERLALVVDDPQDLGAHAGRVVRIGLEAEDDGSDLADGLVELVDHARQATPVLDVGGPSGDALDRHAGGEQLLDDDVVQVAGDALAVLHHSEVLLGVAQPLLALDALAHVAGDLHVARRRVVVARDGLDEDLDRDVGPVTVAVHRGEDQRRPLAAFERTEQLAHLPLAELGRDVQHRHPEQLVLGVADLLARALVRVREAERLRVEDEQRVAGDVERVAHLALRGFRDQPVADVAHDGDDPEPLGALERAQADLDRELRAVGRAGRRASARRPSSASGARPGTASGARGAPAAAVRAGAPRPSVRAAPGRRSRTAPRSGG